MAKRVYFQNFTNFYRVVTEKGHYRLNRAIRCVETIAWFNWQFAQKDNKRLIAKSMITISTMENKSSSEKFELFMNFPKIATH